MKYQLLGKTGCRVSELALGTMTFGTEWGWGADEITSRSIFDVYTQAGGNFIDTANRYTEGTSERLVGDFIASDRDHFVLATKYTLYDRKGDPNFSGNHRKNLIRSVEGSLKRLKTDFIDLLWVHAWDSTTPEQEIMRALDDLIRSGKVHYLGISDTPAWVVARSNVLAELKGWTSFAALQVEYSLIQRTPERELIPMAAGFGMTLTPWAPLAGGALTGKYLKGEEKPGRLAPTSERLNERNQAIARQVLSVAEKWNITPAQVALAWIRQQVKKSIPIVGARRPDQLSDALGCLSVSLDDEDMTALNQVSQIPLGFPHDFLSGEGVKDVMTGGTWSSIIRD